MVLCPPMVRAQTALVRGFRAATWSSSRRSAAGLYLGVCPIPWPKIVVWWAACASTQLAGLQLRLNSLFWQA